MEKGRQRNMLKAASMIADAIKGEDCEISEIFFDDNGNCIHATLVADSFGFDMIGRIGKVFGDETPDIQAISQNSIRLVMLNSHEDLLIEGSDFIKLGHTPETTTEDITIVSIAEYNGEKGVRLRVADIDIFIEANNIDNGKKFVWADAMKRLEEHGKRTFNKHEGYFIAAFIDEINEKLTEIGGTRIEGYFWGSSEYSQGYAWAVNFSSGYVGTNSKYSTNAVVRPVAAS